MRAILFLTLFALLLGLNCKDTMQSQPTDETLPERIEQILNQHPEAHVAISLRGHEEHAHFDVHEDRIFHAASTMKIPVMIEVYRLAAQGKLALADSIIVENAFRSIVDGSVYSIVDDSDDAIYARLGQKMSIQDLVYQMITVSSNLATNILIDRVSADSIQQTIESIGTQHMRVLRGVEDLKAFEKGLSNTATASDLALLLEALKNGRAVTETMDSMMIDVLLDQQFNEMIPADLPDGVRVAHKTGQITNIHHDAGIVYYSDKAAYVLVILIEGIANESSSAALGAQLARAIHDHITS